MTIHPSLPHVTIVVMDAPFCDINLCFQDKKKSKQKRMKQTGKELAQWRIREGCCRWCWHPTGALVMPMAWEDQRKMARVAGPLHPSGRSPDTVPSSWFQPGPALPVAVILGVNHQMEARSLSLCLTFLLCN